MAREGTGLPTHRWRRPHEWSWKFWFVLLVGLTLAGGLIGLIVYFFQ